MGVCGGIWFSISFFFSFALSEGSVWPAFGFCFGLVSLFNMPSQLNNSKFMYIYYTFGFVRFVHIAKNLKFMASFIDLRLFENCYKYFNTPFEMKLSQMICANAKTTQKKMRRNPRKRGAFQPYLKRERNRERARDFDLKLKTISFLYAFCSLTKRTHKSNIIL